MIGRTGNEYGRRILSWFCHSACFKRMSADCPDLKGMFAPAQEAGHLVGLKDVRWLDVEAAMKQEAYPVLPVRGAAMEGHLIG
jgi:hypothetical protein